MEQKSIHKNTVHNDRGVFIGTISYKEYFSGILDTIQQDSKRGMMNCPENQGFIK